MTSTISSTYVPSLGPETADIVCIGEAPGEEEERNKEPFWPTARAGEKLMNCLGRNGVSRDEVFLTNLCKHRPPGNKFETLLHSDELKKGLQELHEELLHIKPKVIAALGNWPLFFLTGKHGYKNKKPIPGSGITHWRGSILPCILKDLEQTKVIPTYHPAAIAREAKIYPIFDLDIKRIIGDSQFPGFKYPQRKLIINPTKEEIDKALEDLLIPGKLFSFDIETFGDTLACCGFSSDPSWAICIPWNVSEYNNNAIKALLTSVCPKVPHFGFFDVSYLKWYYNIQVGGWEWDTFIAQRVLEPEMPRTLDYLTSIYTREVYYKPEGRDVLSDQKSWGFDVEKNKLWIYNCKDAAVTIEIAQIQRKEIEGEKNLVKTMNFDMIQSRELCIDISYNGMLVDKERLEKIKRILIKKWSKHQIMLNNLVGQIAPEIESIRSLTEDKSDIEGLDTPVLFNPNSSKQCVQLFYKVYNLPERRKKGGGVTADEDAIISLLAEVKKEYDIKVRQEAKEKWLKILLVLKNVWIVRGLRKRLSSYVYIDLSRDGRARSLFKLGPETARWSASKYIDNTGLNLQTTPRDEVEEI